ncbi:hypothetical protein [Algiphilus sp.]|uniref:hypothetical protein n=1 Tax=Algiphilus sp. TaxID=1872431 RepID=UPI0025C45007|nr:hypothetical protein [Algiphilus sp.]MCK5772121.1 hypothetical protein [Algiphilus sp.]
MTESPNLTRPHWQRLRRMYRSAGWPCLDAIELDLLAAGLLERIPSATGPDTLRVTDAGIAGLAGQRQQHQQALTTHQQCILRVAEHLHAQNRVCFSEISLRAKPGERWLQVRPDLYSIRKTTRAAYLEPVIHEIKVRRSDLLGDLKRPDKRAAYQALATRFYYVLGENVGDAADIPDDCGVLRCTANRLELLREAPPRAAEVSFASWMALAKATPLRTQPEPPPEL